MKYERLNCLIDNKLVEYIACFSNRKSNTIRTKICHKTFNILVFCYKNIPKKILDQIIVTHYFKLENEKRKKQNNTFINFELKILKILGFNYELKFFLSEKNKLKKDENKIIINAVSKNKAFELIDRYLLKQAKKIIPFYINEIANKYDFKFNDIFFRKYKNAWAKCKWKNKDLIFSPNLIHFDLCVIKYVICHELSHLIHPNHSKNFWSLVKKLHPNYLECKKKLAEFDLY